jgi:hypothetical protein
MSRTLLILLLLFIATTAIPSGAMLALSTDGSAFHLSVSRLEGTPFTSYLIPGLVLSLVVGGSALVAMIAIIIRHQKARALALFAGVMQGGWIVVQVLLLGIVSNLQFLYIGIAIVIILLAWQWKVPQPMNQQSS